MSAVSVPTIPRHERAVRVTQARVALSEWTKFQSLRSTRWSLGVGFLLTIAFPLLFAAVTANRWAHMSVHERADRHPLDIALAGVNVAQLAIAVLGVLVITGEYSTGMIRATFTAVPKRLPVLWAKVGVYGVLTLIVSVPATLVAFFSAQSILAGHMLFGRDISLSISDPGVARVVVGGALYLTVAGIFGLGLGAIIRNPAGGIAAFAAILFVIPPLLMLLPSSWDDAISPYLPSNAGQAIMQFGVPDHTLGPWTGLALFVGYTAGTIAAAAVLLWRRDV